MNVDQKIIFADTVFTQEVDGEMVLLDIESENYFGLDEVGTSISQAMQENGVLQEVLKDDLIAFVEKLQESGLVEVVEN